MEKRKANNINATLTARLYRWILLGLGIFLTLMIPMTGEASAAGRSKEYSKIRSLAIKTSTADTNQGGELHAFYPSNAVFNEQMKKYIDNVDSLSFAWSRIDGGDPGALNTVKGKNGNWGFYYPADFQQPVEYAKSRNKSIQLNIYMDGSDYILLLPYQEQRAVMIQAIISHLQTEIIPGKGIFYDGVVIDFEGLRDTDSQGTSLLYEGKPISAHYTQFLTELRVQLDSLSKKLFTAVNPGLYYDGFDYKSILALSDRMILMAHDYEPTGKLEKHQVKQYTGYQALDPIHSMAPIRMVRQALNEMSAAATEPSDLSRIWLQITFDSAQWRYDVKNAAGWESLEETALSREERLTPLYQAIKDRVDNKDGLGQKLTYGFNQELQTPYLQYFHAKDLSWNIILYEDSNSIAAKIDLAGSYGLGGISLWSLANLPDYTDSNGRNYHLDGWTTILDRMKHFGVGTEEDKKEIRFTDPAIEKSVREKLGKPTGKLTAFDMQGIYRLKLQKGVKSLSDLKHLTGLEYLDAGQLGLKDITAIGKLTELRVLYLQRNQISELSPLKKLTKLEVLSLNGNLISSLTPLSSLGKLKELYLRENQIKNITALSKLKQLELLELGQNQINKADAISKLKNLKQLSLDNNKISELKALSGLTNLQALYLQRNTISNIKPLSGLSRLKIVSLNGNRIADLKPLAGLTSLEKLYLKENRIKSVTPLAELTKLTELYLGKNLITDYSPLKKLAQRTGFLCDFKLSE